MWLVLSAQFLATSTSSIVAGLPDWLYHLYTIVSFFNLSSSYVSYEGCDSGYRFQSSFVIMVGASLLAMAQATLLCTAHKRLGLAVAAGFVGSTMTALYSVVLKQSLQFLHCAPSAHGAFDFTGGVATTRVEPLPDGTTLTETVYLRCAPTWVLSHQAECEKRIPDAGAGWESTCRSALWRSSCSSSSSLHSLSGPSSQCSGSCEVARDWKWTTKQLTLHRMMSACGRPSSPGTTKWSISGCAISAGQFS